QVLALFGEDAEALSLVVHSPFVPRLALLLLRPQLDRREHLLLPHRRGAELLEDFYEAAAYVVTDNLRVAAVAKQRQRNAEDGSVVAAEDGGGLREVRGGPR